MDISFHCANCGQHILIDESGAGMKVDCPSCKQSLIVPIKSAPAVASKALDKSQESRAAPSPQHPPPMIQSRPQVLVCPSCGTDNIVKASAAYEQGTSITAGQSRQVGGVLYSDGAGHIHAAPMLIGGTSGGTQQTSLARRLAPPTAPSVSRAGSRILAVFGAVIIVGGIFGPAFDPDHQDAAATVMGLVGALLGLGLCALAVYTSKGENAAFERQKLAYVEATGRWAKLWYCLKCGNTFEI
jgi:DNA-directed RNA polymerase subunit RPC12/RpoP